MHSPRRLARTHHRPKTTATTTPRTLPLGLPRNAAGRWRRPRSPRSCPPSCARCGCASGRRSTPSTREPLGRRLALGQLEECTDWLLAACDADGRRGAVDWAALRSDEGLAKSEWLVVTILYIYSHA